MSYQFADDGSLSQSPVAGRRGRPADQGARCRLEACRRRISADVVEERPIPYESRRADALAAVAESFLAESHAPSSTADRYQVVVHVDAETLQERTAGRCEIEQGPSLPVETVRRLACDASLLRVLENPQGEPLDVGRKTRSIPPTIRRALNSRDGGCRFPGCTHQRYVDAHHIEHWAEGGETKLANLVTLCRLHHSDAAATRWRGERMDYDLGVWVLCNQAKRAREKHDVSSGNVRTYYLRKRDAVRAPRQIRSRSSGNSMPAAFAAWGRRLVAVMPGSEFASRHQNPPAVSRRKSVRL